jgi:hypothetical protein
VIVNRKTSIRWNPARKPIHLLSDRAKRYRANAEGVKPGPPRWCMFCGARKAEVHHINGSENTCTPDNLGWSCRRCNVAVGNRLRKAGLGRLTRQFNPARRQGTRKAIMDEYAAAIKVMRGQFDGDVARAVATIRATPPDIRSAYTRRTWSTRKAIYGPSGRQSELPF